MSYTQSAPKVNEVDRQLIGIYLALVALGWFMIYSVTYNPDIPYSFLDMSTLPGKQLMFMVICFGMMLVIMLTDWTLWRTFSIPIYLFTLLLLPGTLILGREVNGAHAWYQIGGFTFQPAELAKFGTCLAMAGFLSSTGADLREWRTRLIAFSILCYRLLRLFCKRHWISACVLFICAGIVP